MPCGDGPKGACYPASLTPRPTGRTGPDVGRKAWGPVTSEHPRSIIPGQDPRDAEAQLAKAADTLTNPVAAGLVSEHRH